jgi:hypothetical protein
MQATVTRRTANETTAVVTFINSQMFNKSAALESLKIYLAGDLKPTTLLANADQSELKPCKRYAANAID